MPCTSVNSIFTLRNIPLLLRLPNGFLFDELSSPQPPSSLLAFEPPFHPENEANQMSKFMWWEECVKQNENQNIRAKQNKYTTQSTCLQSNHKKSTHRIVFTVGTCAFIFSWLIIPIRITLTVAFVSIAGWLIIPAIISFLGGVTTGPTYQTKPNTGWSDIQKCTIWNMLRK